MTLQDQIDHLARLATELAQSVAERERLRPSKNRTQSSRGGNVDMQAVEQAIFALLGHRPRGRLSGRGPQRRRLRRRRPRAGRLGADARFHARLRAPRPRASISIRCQAAHTAFRSPSGPDWDRSGMGQSVSTQCLIVPPEVLARFGNNPFALVRAASADGAWQLGDLHDAKLDPLAIAGGAAAGRPAAARAIGGRSRPGEHGRAGASGVRGGVPGRFRHALARATDCRAVQLSAAGVPAGVFVLDGSEVLAAAAVPHRGALRRPGRTAVGRPLSQRHGVGVARERIAAGGAAGRLGPADRADVGRRPDRLPGRTGVEAAIPSDAGRSAGLGPSIARGVGRLGAWRRRDISTRRRGKPPPASGQQAHAAHRQFGKSVEAGLRRHDRLGRPAFGRSRSQLAGGPRKAGATRRSGVRSHQRTLGHDGTTPGSVAQDRRTVGRAACWPSRGNSICGMPCRSGTNAPTPTASAIPLGPSRPSTFSACSSATRHRVASCGPFGCQTIDIRGSLAENVFLRPPLESQRKSE